MEATVLSVGKSVLNGAVGFAKSAIAEEVALQLGVQRDHAFVTGELEMMQSFLMAAHEERDEHKVIKTWVKQVRDVAYDVEDSVQDFVVRLQKPSWWRLWRIPRMLLDRRHVAKQMKDLRAKVEDVSHRNVRYRLINGSNTNPGTAAEQSSTAAAAMFGINEARYDARQHQFRSDLAQLINSGGEDLRVIAVWGTSGSVGHTSIISEAYENPYVKEDFPCRPWVRVMRPFNSKEFVHSLVKQFDAAVGVDVLLRGEKTVEELVQEFNGHVRENRYLIVLTDMSTIEEWHQIKTCFPENRKGCRIIVSTEQVEVASLCVGQESVVSELKQLSTDQTIYAFYTKLVGREKEKSEIINLISNQATQQFDVISVCGTDGPERTNLLQGVCRSQEIRGLFGKHAFITVLQPFKLEELLRSLAMQLYGNPHKKKGVTGSGAEYIASMTAEELIEELGRLSDENRCLIVVDDLLSTKEWDLIVKTFHKMKNTTVIVITTRQEDIAKYCCQKQENICMLTGPGGEEKLVGREKEISEIIKLVSKQTRQQFDVISVCGTDDVERTTLLKGVYRSQGPRDLFTKHGFITVLYPFKLEEFLRSLTVQFYGNPHKKKGVTACGGAREKNTDLMTVEEMIGELSMLSEKVMCLIVVNYLLSTTEWDQIIQTFRRMKNTTGIIVITTRQKEIAKYCCQKQENICMLNGPEDDTSDIIEDKSGPPYGTYSDKVAPISNDASTSSSTSPRAEILEEQSKHVNGKTMKQKSLTRTRTIVGVQEEPQLVGREKEKSEITKLISEQAHQQFEVVAVWGMGGLGKTTLVKYVYHSQKFDKFGKRAFVTVLRPFKPEQLLRSLAVQLQANISEKKDVEDFAGDSNKKIASMGVAELIELLGRLSKGKKCLIVLDDLSSTSEWDKIMQSFRTHDTPVMGSDEMMQSFLKKKDASWTIMITTRQEDIAKHCCKKPQNICMLNGLEDKDARDLFTEKVFKKTTDLKKEYPELVGPTKLILKKCNGLPLAIVTIASFLADQPTKTAVEWRKLNEHISAELEMNPELEVIKTVLMKSYDGLPYYLKACFLYLSIFPEDHNISRRRLVHRWVAEGYSMELREKSAVEMADSYFLELIERSMILPTQQSVSSRQRIDSCQLHDLIRDISIAKSAEENLVFRLEEGCSSKNHGAVRHLVISSNWEGDEREFESTVEYSRIRSLTVFGKWRSFYISDKMRFLRVLDLENTEGLVNYHLEHIGKLLHLRYLSLRGCDDIVCLPDSLGNLRQLETMDIKGTSISVLPKTIIKLRKLCYLHAGSFEDSAKVPCIQRCLLPLALQCAACATCCFPEFCDEFDDELGDVTRKYVCPSASCKAFPLATCCMHFKHGLDESGVMLPRGVRKLKALHTLRFVHLGRGNTVLEEIKNLTGLRKLGVVGISNKNASEFCSGISNLNYLESLSIVSETELFVCLDGMPSTLENLQSLKLCGNLAKLPKLINGLQSLVKLKLKCTTILGNEEAMQILGDLPNLSILHLCEIDIEVEEIKFRGGLFKSLMVLEISYSHVKIKSVSFDRGTMPKLEVLVMKFLKAEPCFCGLEFLQNIKEVRLNVYLYLYSYYDPDLTTEERWKEAGEKTKARIEEFKDYIQKQFEGHPSRPILKLDGIESQFCAPYTLTGANQ